MKKFGTAIILAGGKSSRMGFDKQFLKINNKRLIDMMIEKLKKEFEEIIIVTNKPKEYRGYGQKILTDIIKNAGPLAGIYTGLKEAKFEYAFVIACDMPNIDIDYINYMKEIIDKYKVDVCITKVNGNIEPFHGFYSKKITESIREHLETEKRDIKSLVKKLNTYYIEEKLVKRYSPSLDIFKNLNTKKDLEHFNEKLGGKSSC
ncbi:molybdenum cofactor guanylyltransferase [Keratinibaculum paraultunense]|uniref:Probable molybdenum cofactor guanylyltransferase n=1 Tax=Keratinibaculum paraultunense TaxID=1278232 RepID=A0A4R3KQE6_9FIRM|nr:molybdenum cofactor guanylyltransferase [Keratinibaculum paraultunense]QQY79628.1 molybdenum cofactor guanylyltransferase [Keratinibaculum paraultunense]TCS87047.1 molybdenum cofactor guanylyltransferase [Keratinibaculum paraultunense]